MRERGVAEREREDGVERTHREARSHDLMNELAWLLRTVVGYTRVAFTLPRRRLSSFAPPSFCAVARGDGDGDEPRR